MPGNIISNHNVNVYGKGARPIIFAHGLACDQNVWSYIIPAFEEQYKIVLFDYIGSGDSDLSCYDKEKYSSLTGYANDIIAICQKLNLQDVILVGHSVSCMIGLYAAIAQPALFSTVIMICPSPRYINDSGYFGGFEKKEVDQLLAIMKDDYEKWVDIFVPKALGENDKPELIQDLKEIFCKSDPAITYEFAKLTYLSDSRKDLQQLKTPTLILQTLQDPIAPKQVGKYVHENIPNSALICMEDTGHLPHLTAPDETVKLIQEYLKR